MSESSGLRVDGYGQVIGISHHDGRIGAILFRSDEQFELLVVGSGGEETSVLLLGVEYLALNNLREGNIIDRMYFWDLTGTPAMIMSRMLKALAINSENVLVKKFGDNIKVFHLECSYGAELFAVVQGALAKTISK